MKQYSFTFALCHDRGKFYKDFYNCYGKHRLLSQHGQLGLISSTFIHSAFSKLFCALLIATCEWQPAQLSVTCEWHNQNNFCTKKHGEICFQKQAAFFCLSSKKAARKHVNEIDARRSTMEEQSTINHQAEGLNPTSCHHQYQKTWLCLKENLLKISWDWSQNEINQSK